jgi:hypothetical protein
MRKTILRARRRRILLGQRGSGDAAESKDQAQRHENTASTHGYLLASLSLFLANQP